MCRSIANPMNERIHINVVDPWFSQFMKGWGLALPKFLFYKLGWTGNLYKTILLTGFRTFQTFFSNKCTIAFQMYFIHMPWPKLASKSFNSLHPDIEITLYLRNLFWAILGDLLKFVGNQDQSYCTIRKATVLTLCKTTSRIMTYWCWLHSYNPLTFA